MFFLQFPDQTKQTASCLLVRLIQITTKVREGSACKPHTAPLWSARLSPIFVLACTAASTFHAWEGTPVSTQKDALLLIDAPSFYRQKQNSCKNQTKVQLVSHHLKIFSYVSRTESV